MLVPLNCTVEGKVASVLLTEHQTMKAYWGSGGIASGILDLGTRWRWVVSFTHPPLYPQGKSLWYPLDVRLGGPQSRYGRGSEKFPASAGSRTPDHQGRIVQPYTTELSRYPKLYSFEEKSRLSFFKFYKLLNIFLFSISKLFPDRTSVSRFLRIVNSFSS
jgi:hypothetical protein